MERWSGSSWKLPALSGVMLGLSYYAPLLVFNLFALFPLLYWLERHPQRGRYPRLRAGLVAGLVAHLFTTHFLLALTRFSWLAVLLYLGVALGLAIKLSLMLALLDRLRRRTGLPWSWLLCVVWLPFEWLFTFGDLRLTADHLYHGMTPYPFVIQFADLLGPYGVSAVVLAFNGLAYEALIHRGRPAGRRAGVALALLVALVLGYDAWAWWLREEPPGRTIRVGIVQPNIELLVKWDDATARQQWDKLQELTEQAAAEGAELIVWPETARPWTLFHWLDRPDTYAMLEVGGLARRLGVTLLVGVEYVQARSQDDFDLYNAAMVVDPAGNLRPEWSGKVYLVPFTERLPFKDLLGRFVEGRGGEWRWLSGGFTPADGVSLLRVDGRPVGALVCYEQLFPELSRELSVAGAELQVVVTNDAWFGRTLFQQYQADALRLRAIENRSHFVRAANTGISGFVDAKGRFFQATPLYVEAVEVRDVKLAATSTLYGRTGDVIAWLSLVGLGVTLAWSRRRRGGTG